MAKLPEKKVATKKATPAKKKATKKASPKKGVVKKVVKIPLTEKQEEQKEANRIANTENKKAKPKTAKRPKKESTKEQTMSLLDAVVDGMKEKKAKNITIINLSKLEHRVADYFVICDADSTTHVHAIADSLEDCVILPGANVIVVGAICHAIIGGTVTNPGSIDNTIVYDNQTS